MLPPDNDFQDISAALRDEEAEPAFRPPLLMAVLAVAVVALAFWLGTYSQQRSTRPPVVGPFYGNGVHAVAEEPESIAVHVSGAVRKPGVYHVETGTSVEAAIQLAGGPTENANMQALNLAAAVEDGSKIEVPGRGRARILNPLSKPKSSERPSTRHSSPPRDFTKYPVNINTATAQELEELPRIGPATARKIVDYRNENGPFREVEDLQAVDGIGPESYSSLKGFITVK